MGCVGVNISRLEAVTGSVTGSFIRPCGVSLYIIRLAGVTGSVKRLFGSSLQLTRQGSVTVCVIRVCQLDIIVLMLSAENGLWIMTEDGNNYINLR